MAATKRNSLIVAAIFLIHHLTLWQRFKISGEDAIKPFVTTKTNGLGLGLNIVSEIMIAQNGTIVFPENGDIDLPQELQDGAVVMLAFSKE